MLKHPFSDIRCRAGLDLTTIICISWLPFLEFGVIAAPAHYLGSVTTTTRSPATSRSTCLVPLGHVISISVAILDTPRPKCTRESLAHAYPVLVVA